MSNIKLDYKKVASLFARVAFNSPVTLKWRDGVETSEPGLFKLRNNGDNTIDGNILARGVDAGYKWTVKDMHLAVVQSAGLTLAQVGAVPADSALADHSAHLRSDGLRVWLASLDIARRDATKDRAFQNTADRETYRALRSGGSGTVTIKAGELLATPEPPTTPTVA